MTESLERAAARNLPRLRRGFRLVAPEAHVAAVDCAGGGCRLYRCRLAADNRERSGPVRSKSMISKGPRPFSPGTARRAWSLNSPPGHFCLPELLALRGYEVVSTECVLVHEAPFHAPFPGRAVSEFEPGAGRTSCSRLSDSRVRLSGVILLRPARRSRGLSASGFSKRAFRWRAHNWRLASMSPSSPAMERSTGRVGVARRRL